MPTQKFNILFSGNVREDAISLAEYIEQFYLAAKCSQVDIRFQGLWGVLAGMSTGFPTPDGSDKASPFKKVAAFTVFMTAERPILTSLPQEIYGELATQQNAILAYGLSIDALHGAKIIWENGEEKILKNRIVVSVHFWKDVIAALSNSIPSHHFYHISLLYESLAYQFNPEASYPRVI